MNSARFPQLLLISSLIQFQNHRNRAKKEGRKLQRLQSDFPLNRAIELSEVQIKHYEDHPSPVQESEENEGEEVRMLPLSISIFVLTVSIGVGYPTNLLS